MSPSKTEFMLARLNETGPGKVTLKTMVIGKQVLRLNQDRLSEFGKLQDKLLCLWEQNSDIPISTAFVSFEGFLNPLQGLYTSVGTPTRVHVEDWVSGRAFFELSVEDVRCLSDTAMGMHTDNPDVPDMWTGP